MIAKLYLPYYPSGEEANGQNDMTDEEYANALLNQFGQKYNAFMDKAVADASDSRYGMMDVMPDEYKIKSVTDKATVRRYEFICQVNDDDDKPVSDSELDYYLQSGDMCAFFIHIMVDERTDTDAVSELNFWLRDSRNIMNDRNIGDDYKVGMLPPKDLVIVTDARKFVFSESRVVDQDNTNNFAIIVNKIKKY